MAHLTPDMLLLIPTTDIGRPHSSDQFTHHQPIENSVQPLLRAPAAGKKGMQAWGARRALKKETIQQTEGSHWSPTPSPTAH